MINDLFAGFFFFLIIAKLALEKEKKHDFSKYFSMQCQISLVSPLKTRLEKELNIIQVQTLFLYSSF